MTTEQRDYRTEARGDPAASVEEAKAAARAEGRRVRTVARIRTRSGDRYIVTLALDVLPELHEFVPFPITAQDKPGHVCRGACACDVCSMPKGDRRVHLQNRDRRRPIVEVPA